MPLDLEALERIYEQEKAKVQEVKVRRNFVQQERVL